jgi:hypothetical protein
MFVPPPSVHRGDFVEAVVRTEDIRPTALPKLSAIPLRAVFLSQLTARDALIVLRADPAGLGLKFFRHLPPPFNLLCLALFREGAEGT